MKRNIYIPPRPNVTRPSPKIYDHMGEENIFQMLEDFYMELEKSSIRDMFPQNMKAISKKSAAFFVGVLGGPPLYQQRYGNPMMRARHLPIEIDEEARLVWLRCFNHVLDNAVEAYNFPEEHLPGFRSFLDEFSQWMVNKA